MNGIRSSMRILLEGVSFADLSMIATATGTDSRPSGKPRSSLPRIARYIVSCERPRAFANRATARIPCGVRYPGNLRCSSL